MPAIQTAKQVAIQAAKQTVRESNEFIKSAREQIAPPPQSEQHQEKPEEKKEEPKVDEAHLASQKSRMMQAYDSELTQIRRDNLFKELQRKISQGEEITLEDFITQLSSEQREVLKAQMEAIKMQKEAAQSQSQNSIPEIISKKGRQMFNKIKKRNEQHVETRQPPSS